MRLLGYIVVALAYAVCFMVLLRLLQVPDPWRTGLYVALNFAFDTYLIGRWQR